MNNKILYKIANISGWILLVILCLYFISGYAMVREYGMDALLSRKNAHVCHEILALPFFIALILHVVPYYMIKKQLKRLFITFILVLLIPFVGVLAVNKHVKPANPQVENQSSQNQTVKCHNCSNNCVLKNGEIGDCGHYKNSDGKIIRVEDNDNHEN